MTAAHKIAPALRAKRAADDAEWNRPVAVTLAGLVRYATCNLLYDEVQRLEAEARRSRPNTPRRKALGVRADQLRAVADELA